MILSISQGGFCGERTVDSTICIGDTSLRKYTSRNIKPMSNINKITCVCKTCISNILLQSDLNKLRLSQFAKIDELYINSASTRNLEIPKNYFIEFKKQIFPNDSHIHLRSCDAVSSYHFSSPSVGLKIPKWECIFNCCSDCPRTNYPYL